MKAVDTNTKVISNIHVAGELDEYDGRYRQFCSRCNEILSIGWMNKDEIDRGEFFSVGSLVWKRADDKIISSVDTAENDVILMCGGGSLAVRNGNEGCGYVPVDNDTGLELSKCDFDLTKTGLLILIGLTQERWSEARERNEIFVDCGVAYGYLSIVPPSIDDIFEYEYHAFINDYEMPPTFERSGFGMFLSKDQHEQIVNMAKATKK